MCASTSTIGFPKGYFVDNKDELGQLPVCHASDIRLVRVKETLRNRDLNPTLFVIDDEENILQAARAGVELLGVFISSNAHPPAGFLDNPVLSGADIACVAHTDVRDIFGSERLSRVFALARWHDRPQLTDILDRPGDIIVLDGVRLVGNIGAIIRNACAFRAAGVVVVDSGLSDLVDRRLIRASRGTVFSIPVVFAEPEEAVAQARAKDIPLAVLDGGAEHAITEIGGLAPRVGLVLGSEKTGPSLIMHEAATSRYRIDISSAIESLNVSVAAAIAMYERARSALQRF